MDLKIKTYLRIYSESKFVAENIISNPLAFFLEINDSTECANRLEQERISIDHYTRGLVLIEHNYQKIIGFTDHDLIMPLWWNFLVEIEEYISSGDGELHFQDQPLKLVLERRKGNRIVITKIAGINKKLGYWDLNESQFLKEFTSSAILFYKVIANISNDGNLEEGKLFATKLNDTLL